MKTKHTELLAWLKVADDEAVQRTGTTRAYLRQIAYGNKVAAPIVAASLERETNQRVTRKALRPDDWNQIWPELDAPQGGTVEIFPEAEECAA